MAYELYFDTLEYTRVTDDKIQSLQIVYGAGTTAVARQKGKVLYLNLNCYSNMQVVVVD